MRAGRAALAALATFALFANGYAADGTAAKRGAEVYARCAACHAVEGNRTGPQHCGLFGRRAGTAPGFTGYSDALRGSRIVWDAKTLDHFLRDPMTVVPETTMTYAGVKDAGERADLIAWLREATRPGVCKLSK